MLSLVIPVYKNEGSMPQLLEALEGLHRDLNGQLEVVFVIDGSPDNSASWLHTNLPKASFSAKLLELSRNFGSFAAIRAGLAAGTGQYFAVMAADLQEPPSLIIDFYKNLSNGLSDVVIGTREGRSDPLFSRLSARIFWGLYRRFVQRDMPSGGVDIFGCNEAFRNQLLLLPESNSSLVGLVFWVGFRRSFVKYTRQARQHGKSAWTLKKKIRYLSDSVFAFSDLPIRLLLFLGSMGLLVSLGLSFLVLSARLLGWVAVPGYAATVLVILFFAGLNSLGLGVIGSYVWRAFENTKDRPLSIVMRKTDFIGAR
jgi:glycosyltransferase involved in cell wall biosynthesis